MKNRSLPSLFILTGIMASGKSTVAEALARRLPESVHVRGDVFRKFVVNGREEMTAEPSDAALSQLQLRHELAIHAARRYVESGFNVVLQDVILGHYLQEFVDSLKDLSVAVVVLCPTPDVAEARDLARKKRAYQGWSAAGLDAVLRRDTPKLGLWLDNSRLSVEETVDEILGNTERSWIV